MKNALIQCVLFIMGANLAACSSFYQTLGMDDTTSHRHVQETNKPVASREGTPTGTVGSGMGQGMTAADKEKFSHALDKPLGKSTTWINENSGVNYTVTPTQKLTIGSNPYCRQYHVTTAVGSQTRETGGTACVAADGNWQSVSHD